MAALGFPSETGRAAGADSGLENVAIAVHAPVYAD